MQARLGIIIGPSPEMQRIVEDHGLGVVAEGFDEAAIARAIDSLTPQSVMAFKQAADRAADQLSAERQVETWADAVDAIVKRRQSGL